MIPLYFKYLITYMRNMRSGRYAYEKAQRHTCDNRHINKTKLQQDLLPQSTSALQIKSFTFANLQIQMRRLIMSCLIRIYTVCHSVLIFDWHPDSQQWKSNFNDGTVHFINPGWKVFKHYLYFSHYENMSIQIY